jgi:hypothetical protein
VRSKITCAAAHPSALEILHTFQHPSTAAAGRFAGLERDLFGKPVPAFPDHALEGRL